jgi:hypothetical protein
MPGECRYERPYVCDDCSGATLRRKKMKIEAVEFQEVLNKMSLGNVELADLPVVLGLVQTNIQLDFFYTDSDKELERFVTTARQIVEKYKQT